MFRSLSSALVLFFATLALSACAGRSAYVKPVQAERVVQTPSEGKALVIFMRPSGMGFAVQSSVFEGEKFVGIVPAKKKIAYMTDPGEHTFMLVGETQDFLAADLAAGKTYYVIVSPRMGAFKARFVFDPVRKEEIGSAEMQKWIESCEYVENDESAYTWAEQNKTGVSRRLAKLPNWQRLPESKKAVLRPEDGT